MADSKSNAKPAAPATASAPAKSGGAGSGEISFAASDVLFVNRRSPVLSTHGSVASSQPLATAAGIAVLKAGGNAVDAAVAVAAALQVTEPCSTGLGGDCFCLFYDAKTKKVEGLNGSGRCASALTLEKLSTLAPVKGDLKSIPDDSAHFVTVPGACAGWCDAVAKWGRLSMAQILAPAIELASDGVPIHPTVAWSWAKSFPKLIAASPNSGEMLMPDGTAPKTGDIFRNPTLANTLRTIASEGKNGFYNGAIGAAIVDVCQAKGAVLSRDDLKAHVSTFPEPISVRYRGVDVWEIPPNGQGITALLALNILQQRSFAGVKPNSAEHLHAAIEALRLAFADTRYYVADPDVTHVPVKELLSSAYATKRAGLIDDKRATADVKTGQPVTSSDTVYFCVVDGDGNACSFINSNYMGFGTGIVPKGCGFTLQNRGHNFSLDAKHPNALAPNKRPYHTIIPGMATKDGALYCPFGVMGGFMQPAGHVQVMMNMIDFGMNPQSALDVPRFCIEDGTSDGIISLEDGIEPSVVAALQAMGHRVRVVKGADRAVFGRGQIIRKAANGVLWGGSDGRGDGCATGY